MKRLMLLLVPFCLTACSHFIPVYHPPVQQGQIMTAAQVERLQTGMSTAQVQSILGKPLLVNLFPSNRLAYIYTLKKLGKQRQQRDLFVYFRNNRMTSFSIKTFGGAPHFEE